MTTYLITMLVLAIIGVTGTCLALGGEYPRQRSISRAEHLVSLFIQVGMLVWVTTLLLNRP
ncbi:hypothetical protein D3C76_811290 [compost metagenome]